MLGELFRLSCVTSRRAGFFIVRMMSGGRKCCAVPELCQFGMRFVDGEIRVG